MRSNLSLKHWRMPAVAVFAVLAAATPTTRTFAQQPGESGFYTFEEFTGQSKVQLQGTMAEAKSHGHQLDVWRANDNSNAVWLAYDDGSPFQIGKTETFATPAVAPFGNNGAFIAFHTGTDGRINYAFIFGPGSTENSGSWHQIPGQITPNNFAVSAAPIGEGSEEIIVAYRASGANSGTNDQRVWATWMNNNGVWSAAETIGSGEAVGEAVAAPALCLDSAASSLWAVAIGTDNQVWTTHQKLGASSWPNWTPQGAFAGDVPSNDPVFLSNGIQAPSCAAANNGNVGLAYVDGDDHPHYKIMNSNGGTVSNWAQDSTGWQTQDAVQLTSSGPTIFTLITGLPETPPGHPSSGVSGFSGFVYWKQLYAAQ